MAWRMSSTYMKERTIIMKGDKRVTQKLKQKTQVWEEFTEAIEWDLGTEEILANCLTAQDGKAKTPSTPLSVWAGSC